MSAEIAVANKRHGAHGEYVGRPSALGNPFSHLPNTLAQFKVGTREKAVARYRGWLEERIAAKDPRVCKELERLASLARERGSLTLVCWCVPLPCHADVIREFLLAMLQS